MIPVPPQRRDGSPRWQEGGNSPPRRPPRGRRSKSGPRCPRLDTPPPPPSTPSLFSALGLSGRGRVLARFPISRVSVGTAAFGLDLRAAGFRLPPRARGLSHFDLKVGRERGGAAAAAGRHAASRDPGWAERRAPRPPGTLPRGPRSASPGLASGPVPTGDHPATRSPSPWLGRKIKFHSAPHPPTPRHTL